MDGNVKYDSLKEAVDALVARAGELDDPIDAYMEQSQKVGEDGSSAWGGTAAEKVMPVLNKILNDIKMLQAACNDFSTDVNTSLQNYQNADAKSDNEINNIVG